MAAFTEQAVVFNCSDESLYGILHSPENIPSDTGVVILVGGPQYRVGSHRQFVELARGLAEEDIPVFRFDFTGMGDSTGVFPGFESLCCDIRAAIDAFTEQRPEVRKIILWGLCDGASAACFYASKDDRVIGLCMVNPWVRTEQGEAETFLKHYYLGRLLSKGFWRKFLSGKLQLFKALGGLVANLKRTRVKVVPESENFDVVSKNISADNNASLPVKVFEGLSSFSGNLMFIISGNDLTAAEFMDAISKDKKWENFMRSAKVKMMEVPEADHTFSRRVFMDEVIDETASWIKLL